MEMPSVPANRPRTLVNRFPEGIGGGPELRESASSAHTRAVRLARQLREACGEERYRLLRPCAHEPSPEAKRSAASPLEEKRRFRT